MAQKVQILLVDDLDGGDADDTVEFGIDGVAYEIDLSSGNAQKLRDVLSPYVAEARRVGNRRRSSGSRKSAGSSSSGSGSAATIREWARGNGFDVPARGRVSSQVREAYAAAH